MHKKVSLQSHCLTFNEANKNCRPKKNVRNLRSIAVPTRISIENRLHVDDILVNCRSNISHVYRSSALIKQMSPMYEADESYGDDDISYCYHAKEGGGGGWDFTVRHDYSMKRTDEHWELGTWFEEGQSSLFFSFKMYYHRSSNF